jgi:hypothetical protein
MARGLSRLRARPCPARRSATQLCLKSGLVTGLPQWAVRLCRMERIPRPREGAKSVIDFVD